VGASPVSARLLAVGELAPGRSALLLRLPELIAGLRPGHALHLLHAEAGGYRLRRVAPVTQVDLIAGSVQVALQPRADGGRDSLAELTPGAQLSVVGPIGQPIEVPTDALQILVVTDSEGFAWVRFLVTALATAGRSVVLLIEAHTAAEVPSASLLPESVEILVATKDGSLGHQGGAVDLIAQYAEWADQVIASGESELLSAVTRALRASRKPDRISATAKRRGQGAGVERLQLLVAHEVGCGSGVCGGCTYRNATVNVRLCREGPAVPALGGAASKRGAR